MGNRACGAGLTAEDAENAEDAYGVKTLTLQHINTFVPITYYQGKRTKIGIG